MMETAEINNHQNDQVYQTQNEDIEYFNQVITTQGNIYQDLADNQEAQDQEQVMRHQTNEQQEHFNELDQEQMQEQPVIIDPKYGDKKIDLSELQQNLIASPNQSIQLDVQQINDPSRPSNLQKFKPDKNEPLPSYSDKVNIGQFSVGNYKEFQLREDLAHLIEKYNKQFYGDAKKPNIKGEIQNSKGDKEQRYKEKMIINPIAVPHPGDSKGNFSWMYLMTPYYNQLVKEFNSQQLENDILKQHYEYYLEMEKEKELLGYQYEQLRKTERQLQDQVENVNNENMTIEEKVEYMDRNLQVVHPEKFREMNDKLENLQNVLKSKDNVIDQLLNEISLIKNEKDDLQNEVLFKKQKIENLNFEFNTKEHEYQRLWEEEQILKAEIRGESSNCKDVHRENEGLQREIAMIRDEISQNSTIYEQKQLSIQEQRMKVTDYEERLRYGNDVIMQLESENQQVQLDLAQQRAVIEGQNRAYNELKQNFYLLNNQSSGSGQMQFSSSNPVISIPKIVMPSNYFKPNVAIQRSTINLMPSASKALTQQVIPQNIKNYLSIKKTVIDLTPDIQGNRSNTRDQKVRFTLQESLSHGPSNQSPQIQITSPQRGYKNVGKRSDSMSERLDRRTFQNLLEDDSNSRNMQSPQEPSHRRGNFTREQLGEVRVQSVNRNFVDTMGGLLGGSDEKQNTANMRASVQGSNTFPLKRVDLRNISEVQGSPQKSNFKDSYVRDSPGQGGFYNQSQYRAAETDISTNYENGRNWRDNNNGSMVMDHSLSQSYDNFRMSNMGTQTPFKNKLGMKGAPGNRNSQPQQLSSVKQRQHPQSTRNPRLQNETQFRQATWQERMSQLPKISAYKSSITFGDDGVTTKDDQYQNNQSRYSQQEQIQQSYQPFSMARDYDIDIQAMNEDDPQAKAQIIKFKQQKIYELADHRKLLQSQAQHLPEFSKQMSQRQKRQEMDSEIQKITKRISILKYDLKKLTCKDDD